MTPNEIKSTLGFKNPTLRNHFLNLDELWLDDKRANDDAENLWRIHNNLYDFTNFINLHPGGKDWLLLTKGTDITEAFEAHHIREYPQRLLKKYFVRETTKRRNSPFTFHENGFYKTIKRRVREFLPNIPEETTIKSKICADALLISFLIMYLLCARYSNFILATIAGINLAFLANTAHNFFHKKDNFRMYYFDLTLISSKSWRITHALSHHLYSNSVNDLEMSILEPFLRYLPHEKNFIIKYISCIISPGVYSSAFMAHYIKTVLAMVTHKKSIKLGLILPLALCLIMIQTTGKSIVLSILLFLYMETIASFVFLFIAVNSAHHDPNLFHDGDTPRPEHELDWGVHQMDTTKDRIEFTDNIFLVLINYGNHTLHHLFPTIDHSKLIYLYPIFIKTCEEFGLEFSISTQMNLIKGQFVQLLRDKPHLTPPKSYKKIFLK